MNFRQIEFFVALSEELNFTRAADRLYVTQQTLSEGISKLESEYNVRLFDRTRPLKLTPQGQAALPFAYRVLEGRDKMESIFEGEVSTLSLTFGMPSTRSSFVIPEILPRFNKRFPSVSFKLITDHIANLERMLTSGSVDLIMGFDRFSTSSIQSIPIVQERTYLLIPSSLLNEREGTIDEKQLERWKSGVFLRDFADYPFLFRRRMCSSRKMADALFREIALTPNIVFENDDNDTLFRLCLSGMGAMFFSSFLLFGGDKMNHIKNGTLYCFPVASERSFRTILIGSNPSRDLRPCDTAFIDIFRQVHEEYRQLTDTITSFE